MQVKTGFTIIFMVSNFVFAQRSIMVNGAGTSIANSEYAGDYVECKTKNGKPVFIASKQSYCINWDGKQWILAANQPSDILFKNRHDTPLPPQTGWRIVNSPSPPPTLSGDVSLNVDLSSFNASLKNNYILLKWCTKNEISNLGFIIERRITEDNSEWHEVVSYKTNKKLKGKGSINIRTFYSYTDHDVRPGKTYQYRLSHMDSEKRTTQLKTLALSFPDDNFSTPSFGLLPASPNPFNQSTLISYNLDESYDVKLKIIDLLGQEVCTLISKNQAPGRYKVNWDGVDNAGIELCDDIYFIKLEAGNNIEVQEILLQK